MDQLSATTQEEEVEVARNAAYKNRRWHMEVFIKWSDFAVTKDCVSSRDTKELYEYFYKSIRTLDEGQRDEVFSAVLKYIRKTIHSASGEYILDMFSNVSHMLENVTERNGDTDLSVYEYGLVEISSTKTKYPTSFKKFVVECSSILFSSFPNSTYIYDTDLSVVMESIYIKVLRKRSHEIDKIPSAALLATIPFDGEFFLSLSSFLNDDFKTLSIEELEKLTTQLDAYFSEDTFCPKHQRVRGLAGILYRNRGVQILTNGGLLDFVADALGSEQKNYITKAGKLCLLEILCLYLKFCVKYRKTLRNHEFARWVIKLCDLCSFRFGT